MANSQTCPEREQAEGEMVQTVLFDGVQQFCFRVVSELHRTMVRDEAVMLFTGVWG